jgi:hypothetical protein
MCKLKKIIHPIYTYKIENENNRILFDIRQNNNYLNNYTLLYSLSHPDQVKGACIANQQKNKTFVSRKEARRYIIEIINQF